MPKLRVALVSEYPNASVDQAFVDLRTGLATVRPEWEVMVIPFRSFSALDLHQAIDLMDVVHLGSPTYDLPVSIDVPVTANVWHVTQRLFTPIEQSIAKVGPVELAVEDVATLQSLGQMGYTRVAYIPMPFDPGRWARIEPFEGPFTVGAFGDNLPGKRFEIIQRACREAKVGCYMMTPKGGPKYVNLNPVEDVYSQISALAHASFIDTSSRPALEALACGLPVFSTRNEGLGRVANGGNIIFYDGSVQDLAAKIPGVEEKLGWHRECAAYTEFSNLDMVALKYATMFEAAAGGQE